MKTWHTLLIYLPAEGPPVLLESDAPNGANALLVESFYTMGPEKLRGRLHFVFAEPLERAGDYRTITRTARSPFAATWNTDCLHGLAADGRRLLDSAVDPARPWLGFGQVFDLMKANGGRMEPATRATPEVES